MFAIGEKRTKVFGAKIAMPIEYRLRKRKIYGTWVGDDILYISDEIPPLKARNGGIIFEPVIDANSNLHISEAYENCKVIISGCISTIEIAFEGGNINVCRG